MMLIGIISDSHDNMPKIESAVQVFEDRGVGHILHAGDFIAPFTAAPFVELGCRMTGVFGNNDGEKRLLREKFAPVGEIHDVAARLELAGRSICVVHEPYVLDALVASGAFDLIVYGHTHKLDVRAGRTVVLNSGEAGGWVTKRCTVATVDLTSMAVDVMDL
ncbi:MAG: metallophosphoesterase [Armatimonadetes bacterium]|nr:metallophosphoesterase [Armatimonadota bacterium]PIU65635.1 MAG: YfcE family phosphodiesterase [Armatimonadetes bacterium CG07_land_8_20_14_0_80_59_28]PIX44072.1 MAG: YfcE family phosphodiesterase [Armatimonadetes bacterium CG_4_8_14_3_um_filter_58_9]PIY39307.1 MAG: YfcE family phosphodiesterase [Armatimonadetes bacterium CG_4_10_14_3_um_filter_59_10]PJB70705.1 MAG: YfcE family phosphodiesterase [Armatimonadetes bacterium CG_4_9_14_3_um_filter_58_7]